MLFRSLELLHMDLMGPMQVESLGGKRYAFVVVDDYSRYTWVNFIREKSDAFDVFKELCTQIQREKGSNVVRIRSDHGREFEKSKFNEFCSTEGIKHEYSSHITPQQNGVVGGGEYREGPIEGLAMEVRVSALLRNLLGVSCLVAAASASEIGRAHV